MSLTSASCTNRSRPCRWHGRRSVVESAFSPGRLRGGLTLIELLLVLAIIVVVAALSIPSIQRTLKSQGIRSAAKRVVVASGQARVKAIRSGVVYGLFYSPNGSWFDIAPLTEYRTIASRQQNRERNNTEQPTRNLEYDLLPEGVVFISGASADDSRSAASKAEVTAGTMEMVLYYPDGSTQDAQMMLQNQMGDTWRVELRGLTGSATAMKVDPQSAGR